MIMQAKLTIAFFCKECEQFEVAEISPFSLNADGKVISCSACGTDFITISRVANAFVLRYLCKDCKMLNVSTIAQSELMRQKAMYVTCDACSYINFSIGMSHSIVQEYSLENAKGELNFADERTTAKAISIIQWLLKNGNVHCTCSSSKIRMEADFQNIKLECEECGNFKLVRTINRKEIANLAIKNEIVLNNKPILELVRK